LRKSDFVVDEAANGILIVTRSGDNAFTWVESVRVDGGAGTGCSNFAVGPVQMIWQYYALVDWRSTRWSIGYSKIPIRDTDRAATTSPWYNPALVKNVSRCGEEITFVFADRPRLGDIFGRIPWDDPRTGEAGSLQLVRWGANFISYICARDETAKEFLPPLRHIYWSLQFSATLNTAAPIGKRSTIHTSAVQFGNPQNGSARDAPAVFDGVSAYDIVRRNQIAI
jgi:hypothetical protein